MLMDGVIGERMGAMHGDHRFSEFGRAIAKTWRKFTEDVSEGGEDVGFVEGDPPLHSIIKLLEAEVSIVLEVISETLTVFFNS